MGASKTVSYNVENCSVVRPETIRLHGLNGGNII